MQWLYIFYHGGGHIGTNSAIVTSWTVVAGYAQARIVEEGPEYSKLIACSQYQHTVYEQL